MELKLQQAIVATRAGRTDIAQNLLAQLIRENPDDANAWFLMGYLVDAPDRQVLYLQKAVDLDPDHAIARQRLVQLENPPVPAPVISRQKTEGSEAESNEKEASTVPVEVESAAITVAANELPEWLQDLENKQLGNNSTHDESWQEAAGTPIRETQKKSSLAVAATVPQSQPDGKPASDSTSADVWLVRILVIMVIVAAIVLGILVLLILL